MTKTKKQLILDLEDINTQMAKYGKLHCPESFFICCDWIPPNRGGNVYLNPIINFLSKIGKKYVDKFFCDGYGGAFLYRHNRDITTLVEQKTKHLKLAIRKLRTTEVNDIFNECFKA